MAWHEEFVDSRLASDVYGVLGVSGGHRGERAGERMTRWVALLGS
jgi:hypothetical protein